MRKDLIIAIDGFSSTGKSSMSKIIARDLNYLYIDSGSMYRAITFYGVQEGIIKNKYINTDSLVSKLNDIKISFKIDPHTLKNHTYLNDIDIENEIRSIEISNMVSSVSEIPGVRDYCVFLQQEMGKNGGIVMDGRDIGTTVFPNADIKIFVTALPEIRAKRRFLEYQQQGKDISLEDVLNNIKERDYIDSNRDYSPLRIAKDAVEIDNSQMSLEQTVSKVLELIKELH